MHREIYLDNAATTRTYDEVLAYMDHIGKYEYGNPSSLHKKGIEAEKLVKKARSSIADGLCVSPGEIYFTSGGTESNNLAIRGYLEANPRKGKHVITSAIEHPSVLEVCRHLSRNGYRVDFIGVDKNGIVDMKSIAGKICRDTAIISIIAVNNETGAVQPVEEISRLKDSINPDTVLHVDAVQAFGKYRITPYKAGIGMMSVSSHKIHGPKGVGALFIKGTLKVKPVLYGGGQENQLRSGTENVPGISGFGCACGITFGRLEENFNEVSRLKARFLEKAGARLAGFRVVSGRDSSPYILNISFPGVKAEVLLHHLEDRGIYVSTGSACSSRKRVQSHVLKAMGLDAAEIDGAVRFSFSPSNTCDDVDAAVEALSEIIPKITIRKVRG